MDTHDLVTAASPLINEIGSAFYFTPATLEQGTALGLDGFRWYFLGRGGVLGDVEPAVVTSAFGYFNGDLVAKMWTTGREKVAPRAAATAYLACAQAFGRAHFADVEGLEGFCATAEAICAATDPAGLALFAGLNAEPRCDDLPGRAMQLVATLREQRGSFHLLAVVASGLSPQVAHQMKRPDMLGAFGWVDEVPVTDDDRARQAVAEELTDRLLLPSFSGVGQAEAQAMVGVLQAMKAALAG